MSSDYYAQMTEETDDSSGIGCVLVACAIIALVVLFGGGKNSDAAPEPTATPADTSAQVVSAVMDGLAPVFDSLARSVDAGTSASLTDTRTAHPEPGPTIGETIIQFGFLVCFPVCLILLIVAIILLRNPGIISNALLLLGTLDKERTNGDVINSSVAPMQAEPGREPDINIGE